MSGDTPLPSSRDVVADHGVGHCEFEQAVVRQQEGAAGKQRAGGARADQRDVVRLQRIGEDFEAAAGALVDDRHHRLVPANIGEIVLAVAVLEPERRGVVRQKARQRPSCRRPSGRAGREPGRRRPSAGHRPRLRRPPPSSCAPPASTAAHSRSYGRPARPAWRCRRSPSRKSAAASASRRSLRRSSARHPGGAAA